MIRSAVGTPDGALSFYADVAAALVGLTIPEDCRSGVLASLRALGAQAELVMGFPLDAEGEIAPGIPW